MIEILEEATAARAHLAGSGRVRIVVAIDIPAVGRDFGDSLSSLTEYVPVFSHVRRTREAATHSDNGDGFNPLIGGTVT